MIIQIVSRFSGVGMRIGAGFMTILLLMTVMMLTGLHYIDQANQRLKDIVENKNVKTQIATTMLRALRERALSMHAVSVLKDPFDIDDEVQRFQHFGAVYVDARQHLEDMSLSPREAHILENIRVLTKTAQPEVEQVMELAVSGQIADHLEKMRSDAMPRQRQIADEVDALIQLQQQQTADAMAMANDSYQQVRNLMLIMGITTLLLGVGIAIFVSRRESAQAGQLQKQARYDQLTNLPNRTLLQDHLILEIARNQRAHTSFAVLLMDLNGFKAVNDTLGHQAGDLLLCEVGKRLERSIRKTDIVARLGGDEFVIIMHDIHPDGIVSTADNILACLDTSMQLSGQSVDIGVSGGLAVFPWHGEDYITLLRHADIAMYFAKRGGKQLALYSPEQEQLSSSDLSLKSELREAIQRNQLVLHYQPKIDLVQGKVISLEALVRWHHPQRGFMPPDSFIPMAEEAGFITLLTHWVLRTALEQAAALSAAGYPLGVAVNLSAKDLHDSGLPHRIANLSAEIGVSTKRLTLELTESAVMVNPGEALKILTELDRMGITLSIDDFGTGYSSLAYLKRLPVDELKIDKTFVIEMLGDENDAAIVKSAVDLGHNLGLRVVAEGVENESTLGALLALGCDAAQGYYLSKPLPAGELLDWLRTSPWADDEQHSKDRAVKSQPCT